MIKNLTVSLTDRCNGKCIFCNISRRFQNEMTAAQFSQLLENPLFAQIETLSLSGGEMFLHPDIEEIISIALQKPKQLLRLFINTNGMVAPKKIAEQLQKIPQEVKCIVSVSYEGGTEENIAIRGYDNTIHLFELVDRLRNSSNISVSLSMTLCAINCRLKSLYGTKDLAQKLDCSYSFRLSEVAETYYKNNDYNFTPSVEQMREVITFIRENCQDNLFLKKYAEYLQAGKVCYAGKSQKCIAGSVIAFVNSDGNIYPCIYSTKAVGTITSKTLLPAEPINHCQSCYTDCIAWPMIEYYELGGNQR